jgi:hypothetical protein
MLKMLSRLGNRVAIKLTETPPLSCCYRLTFALIILTKSREMAKV